MWHPFLEIITFVAMKKNCFDMNWLNFIFINFMMVFAINCNAAANEDYNAIDSVNMEKIRVSVATMFDDYPDATLQDVYKTCFQDYFGVAHLLGSREQVYNYICRELEADNFMESGRYYEQCGWQGNYYRVHLDAIKNEAITADMLTDAFMASAPEVAPMVTKDWINQWRQIEKIVVENYPHLFNLNEDRAAIDEMLNKGKYVMHHSRRYNKAYHPHYRIIRRDLFERDILPYLPK